MKYHSTKHGDIEVADMNQFHLGFAARKLRRQAAEGTISDSDRRVLAEMEALATKNNWTIPD